MKNLTLVCVLLTISLHFFACTNAGESSDQRPKSEIKSNTVQTTISDQSTEPGFIHTVFFWLKEDATEAEHKAFLQALEIMKTIETIKKATIGRPANTPREVVDNSYDYAWIVHFKNAEDQDAYQVDPVHKAFVEAQSHIWTKVQVYDTLPLK